MKAFFKAVFVAIFVIAMLAFVGLLAAVPLMLLWNWLMPVIFGIKVITYSQAWGLYWLTSILFKSTSSNTSSKS